MIGLFLVSVLAGMAAPVPAAAPPPWEITGELAEACTCKVPCTCQFGEGPTPGPGCRSLITLSIEKGRRGDVKLDGTKLALVFGDKGIVFYVDSSAPAPQRAALRAVAENMAATSKWNSVSYREAPIAQTITPTETRVAVGDAGSFDAEMLLGMDDKTPVVVENQGDVNVARLEKGKTRLLKYGDAAGNSIDAKDTNSDRGHFDWNDRMTRFF
jgi:hypothetical protein